MYNSSLLFVRTAVNNKLISMNKAAVLIDAGYLNKVLEKFGKPKIDYYLLSEKVCQGTERLRTYYYTCMPYQSGAPTEEERKRYSGMHRFISNMKMHVPRLEVRLGRLVKTKDGEFIQKKIDILMSVDLVRMSWGKQIDQAVIITGDSDFVPAVQAAKDAGVLVQLYYYPETIHDELFEACDDRFEITKELIDSCLRN